MLCCGLFFDPQIVAKCLLHVTASRRWGLRNERVPLWPGMEGHGEGEGRGERRGE